MKTKILLTSMVAILAAGQAFATGIPASESTPDCDMTTLGTETPGQTVQLTARWLANTYTITLDNSTNGDDSDDVIYETYNALVDTGTTGWKDSSDATITSVAIPTASEAVFTGYYGASSGGTQYITAAGALPVDTTFTANTTLYAQFADCNDTTVVNGSIKSVSVNNNVCNYVITCDAGYSHDTGSGFVTDDIAYSNNTAASVPSSISVCENARVNLTWDTDGADNDAQVTGVGFCDVGQEFAVPATEPTKTGYTFDGWDAEVVSNNP